MPTAADNGSRPVDDMNYWPYFSFRGHWPQTPLGQACKSALIAALAMPDLARMPFLAIEGLSGSAFRVFLNSLLSGVPEARYLELGVGIGSAMSSALHGNRISGVGVDNFSELSEARTRLWENLVTIDRDACSFTVIDKSFDETNVDSEGPFDVVFYDGPVNIEQTFYAISVVLAAMKDVALYIFDDWNAPEIREAYRRLVDVGYLREIAAIDVRTTLDNSHPSFYGVRSGWHNGYKLALMERLGIPRVPRPLPPITMAEAGAVLSTIESGGAFEGRGSVQLGDGFPHAAAFGLLEKTASLNGYLLNDVVFSFVTMLVYAEWRPIRETAYLVSPRELSLPAPVDTQFQEFTETVIQPLCRAWENYYHWIVQCLPGMLAGIEAGRGKMLALPQLSSRQEESLQLLGLQDFPRFLLQRNRSYGFKSLEVSDITYGGSSFQISTTTRRVYQIMKDRAHNEILKGPRLYLTRQSAAHRRVYNEIELCDLLVRRGFEIIDSGDYTVTQQINLFRHADIVVAPHGAAMTNIGFCNPGATIYELMPEGYVNPCFNRIAQLADLNYTADICQSDWEGEQTARSFTIDLGVVSARLDTLGL